MTMSSKPSRDESKGKQVAKRRGSGPAAFFISLFIIALGAIQLISTFQTYALNLSQLNGLKRQESALVQQKQQLENNIARWNDKAYVTAQARERLGFVFPGEESVTVLHPEAVTGTPITKDSSGGASSGTAQQQRLPWYSELAYAFKEADAPVAKSTGGSGGSTGTPGTGQSTGQSTGK